MKPWILLVAAAVAGVGFSSVYAHTPLASSSPADGGTVAAPVKEIALEFGGPVRLTALALTDSAGHKKALAELPTEITAKFSIAVRDELASGAYVATWRAVGADTHVVSGEIHFTVAPAHSH
jgi:hypothetical protein